jgi:hypothetical protein
MDDLKMIRVQIADHKAAITVDARRSMPRTPSSSAGVNIKARAGSQGGPGEFRRGTRYAINGPRWARA